VRPANALGVCFALLAVPASAGAEPPEPERTVRVSTAPAAIRAFRPTGNGSRPAAGNWRSPVRSRSGPPRPARSGSPSRGTRIWFWGRRVRAERPGSGLGRVGQDRETLGGSLGEAGGGSRPPARNSRLSRAHTNRFGRSRFHTRREAARQWRRGRHRDPLGRDYGPREGHLARSRRKPLSPFRRTAERSRSVATTES